VKKNFERELSSGRARERVLRDIRLAIRLGLSGTPAFLHEGNFVSGERELFEAYAKEKVPAAPRPPPAKPVAR
jgi:predicted DsbA family dithiol-disulfide isomerase